MWSKMTYSSLMVASVVESPLHIRIIMIIMSVGLAGDPDSKRGLGTLRNPESGTNETLNIASHVGSVIMCLYRIHKSG
jgi:hypothetical protein